MFECDPGEPTIIDVREDESQVERKKHKVRLDKLDDLDMAAYRNRVNNVLQAIIDQNETLRKIRLGQPATENDLEDLCSLVLVQEPGLDLHDLMDYFKQAESLDQAIREIIGMDVDAVQTRFTEFVQAHQCLPNLAVTDCQNRSVAKQRHAIAWDASPRTYDQPNQTVAKRRHEPNHDDPFIQLKANEQVRGVAARFLFRVPRNLEGTDEVSTLNHKNLKRAGDLYRARGELPLDDRPLLQILLENCGELLSFQENQIDLDDLVDALPPLDDALFFSPSMISPTGESEHDFRHAFHINLSTELVRAISQFVIGPCQLVRDQLKHFRYVRRILARNRCRCFRFRVPSRLATNQSRRSTRSPPRWNNLNLETSQQVTLFAVSLYRSIALVRSK